MKFRLIVLMVLSALFISGCPWGWHGDGHDHGHHDDHDGR
jgi:hypothetical protein